MTNPFENKNTFFVALLTFFLILTTFSPAYAFNHPEIKWKSVSTKHFNIHFYDKTEPTVYAAWKIAEEAYTALDNLYFYKSTHKINIAIADYDDYSNGFAAWTQRAIMIWVPDSRFDLRSNTTWLRNVITHELTHIMSMEKSGKKNQLFNWSIGAKYASPNINIEYIEPIPLKTFFPMWFAEGTAQMGSDNMNSDCWDSRRDMLQRCAVIDDKLLNLPEMGHFTHDIIGNELVYNQGYSFTHFLENRLGKKNIANIWNKCRGRDMGGTHLSKFIFTNYSVMLSDLFQNWKDSLSQTYEKTLPKNLSSSKPVWHHGTINKVPGISPDGKYWGWLTNHKDDFYRTDLIIAEYGKSTPIKQLTYAHTDWSFSSDSKQIYYIKSRQPNKEGSFYNDIYTCDLATNETTRLTNSARVYAIAPSPDGKTIATIQYKNNAFSLSQFSLETQQFTQLIPGTLGDPFLTLSYMQKNNNKLVVSKQINGKAGIYTVDIEKKEITSLVNSVAQEETPFCASNGRIYFSADYDGIFNIYSVTPEGIDIKKHTIVQGGAFSPVVSSSNTLLYSEYTSKGFKINQNNEKGTAFEIPETCICSFKPVPTPKGKVSIKSKTYKRELLRPSAELLTTFSCYDNDQALQNKIFDGSYGDSAYSIAFDFLAQISIGKFDAVGLKSRYMGAALYLVGGKSSDEKSSSKSRSNNTDIYNLHSNISPSIYNARPNYEKVLDRSRYGILSPSLKKKALHTALKRDTTDNDSSNSQYDSNIIPFLIPYIGIQNKTHTTTLGLDAQIVLIALIPYSIILSPFVEWHIARDIYTGFSPTLSILPLLFFSKDKDGIVSLTAPFWIQWQKGNYFNEDMKYNLAGYSVAGINFGPEIMPYMKKIAPTDSTSKRDSVVYETASGFSFGVQLFKSFSIMKYSSYSLSTMNYGLKLSEKIESDLLVSNIAEFDFIFQSKNETAFRFPIKRNINSGKLYMDNLYGCVFYQFNFIATNVFFANTQKDVFLDKTISSPYAKVSHKIGMRFEMGLIKQYIFQRSFKIGLAWDIFKEEINLDISMWF